MIGFSKLAPEVREEILKKVKKIKAEKDKYINAAKQLSSQAAKLENSKILQAQQTDNSLPSNLPTLRPSDSFTYECPFLINHECSVYEFRGIICRSFGLMSINPEGLSKIPFCAFEGLNYSNVVEPDTKIISTEKYKKLGENIPEPLAFNVGYKFLTSKDIEKNFNIHFGDKKSLIDWF
jgi:Fe-S-cluster containining protein